MVKIMKDFFEKYNSAMWCLVAALWFFVDYIFMETKVDSILYSGIFWIIFSIEEFIRSYKKKD